MRDLFHKANTNNQINSLFYVNFLTGQKFFNNI